jgi:glycosyltransferase involved in cell wall biosynthesis
VSRARVVVVCSNVSNNCLGRALLLADLAKPFADVSVVGANLSRDPIWGPASGFDIPVEAVELRNVFGYVAAGRWLQRRLSGAKVIVSKPMPSSLGLARRAGVKDDQMLLDVDDWEIGLFSGAPRTRRLWDLIRPGKVNSFPAIQRADASIGRCPHRSVSNTWLQKRYGGLLLPHVRDTDVLKPDAALREAARAELKMAGRFWVGFVGTIRKHKGVDDLLAAVKSLSDDVGLYLAGVDERDEYTQKLLAQVRAELSPERLRLVPTFDFGRLPYFLGAADVLCIPSRASDAATGQIPAKLFDALAMGIPVLVSAVNDMAQIVDAAGQIFPAGDVPALAAGIRRYRDDAAFREACGAAARERALGRYSYRSASRELEQALGAVATFAPGRRAPNTPTGGGA